MLNSILLVEDEEALRMIVGDRLRSGGYLVDYAADGDEAFDKVTKISFDLIILDVMLPHRDGFAVCRNIREAGLVTPILMLTARAHTTDKVAALRMGADDYITKPFDMRELIARTEALFRRAPIRSPASAERFQFGPVTVDLSGTELARNGIQVNLTAREFQLLRYFIEHAGTTLSRDVLLSQVWGYKNGAFTRTVDVHVAGLRQKLERDPKHPEFILTVQGLGYKFRVPKLWADSSIDSVRRR
jgi:two-component system, OmpR family, alkaline phosphatase synthesis response regulator PhoP